MDSKLCCISYRDGKDADGEGEMKWKSFSVGERNELSPLPTLSFPNHFQLIP